MLLGTAKWDGYGASVPCHPAQLADMIERVLPGAWGGPVTREGRNGRRSFAQALSWKPEGGGEELAIVQWGGVNEHPHVEWQGMHSPKLVSALRLGFPDHRVSRCDACVDMNAPGLFGRLWEIFAVLDAENPRLKGSYHVNSDPDAGNSYYLGASTSDVRCVTYEKGKQMTRKTGDPAWLMLYRDVARVEARVRPKKEAKSTFARIAPAGVFGASPWLRVLADRCFGLQAEPVSMKPSRTTDHDRAMSALTGQYARTLLHELELQGGDIDAWASLILDRCQEVLADRARSDRGSVSHGLATTSGEVAH